MTFIPYSIPISEYNPYHFKHYVLEYYENHNCCLCKETHPPSFHCFVARKTPFNQLHNISTGYVIRIKCNNNPPGQRTITILPVFIQPYARRLTSEIEDALNDYFNGRISNQLSAALRMNAENEKTFRKYYGRILKRISKWILILTQWLAEQNVADSWEKKPEALTSTVYKRWCHFIDLIDLYTDEVAKIPDTVIISEENRFQYIMALLSQNHLGLGP